MTQITGVPEVRWTFSRTHAEQTRSKRRADELQRMQARGNTHVVPTYREVYGSGGEVVSQVYLGHRAKFRAVWRSGLMDNVSKLKIIGANVADDVLDILVNAARGRQLGTK